MNTESATLEHIRSRPGQWGDKPAVDPRVSSAEQEDRMPDHDSVSIPAWLVCLGLAVAPLFVIGGVSLIYLATR